MKLLSTQTNADCASHLRAISSPARPRILIVDDDPMLRDTHAMLLRLEDYDVETAENGEQALDELRRRAYDLVVTDWNLPKKSGLDVLHSVRAKSRSLPVMMITTET